MAALGTDERRASLLVEFGITPAEIADTSRDGRRHLVERLTTICRNYRSQGLAGHFAYSLPLHTALVRILMQERAQI